MGLSLLPFFLSFIFSLRLRFMGFSFLSYFLFFFVFLLCDFAFVPSFFVFSSSSFYGAFPSSSFFFFFFGFPFSSLYGTFPPFFRSCFLPPHLYIRIRLFNRSNSDPNKFSFVMNARVLNRFKDVSGFKELLCFKKFVIYGSFSAGKTT